MKRILSKVEQANWVMDRAVSLNMSMIAHISGTLPEPVLRQAIDLFQEKFPSFKWKIKDGEPPEFTSVGVPQIPLKVIKREKEDQWVEEVENEMHQQFPWTIGPLARFVQLVSPDGSACDLIFTCCHIHTDGLSGVVVMEEVLNFAGQLLKGENILPPKPLPIPLSSLDLLKEDLKYEPNLSTSSNVIDNCMPVELRPDSDVPSVNRITRVIHKEIVPIDTKKLIKRCKEESTSVLGAISAGFLQAVVEQIRLYADVPQTGPLNIGALSPVNIRHHFVRCDPKDIGYYISFAIHHQLIDNHVSLWEDARRIKESLSKEIKVGQDIKAILGVGDSLNSCPTPVELATQVNQSLPPVLISNLGAVNIPHQYGDLSLLKFHPAGAMNVACKNGISIALMSYKGILTVNFLFCEPYRSRETATKIAESTMKRIKDAIS